METDPDLVHKVEITEMPSKELLEFFISQSVNGLFVEVYFDWQKGVFIDTRQPNEAI